MSFVYIESCCPDMGSLHTNNVIAWSEEMKWWIMEIANPTGGQVILPVFYCPHCGTKQESLEEREARAARKTNV